MNTRLGWPAALRPWRRWIITAAVLVLLRAALPLVLRSVIASQASQALHAPVTVGDVTIALRPEHVQLDDPVAEEPAGRIVSRVFHGHDLTIRVAFAETELTVWDDYRCRFRVGESVRVRPREKGIVVD